MPRGWDRPLYIQPSARIASRYREFVNLFEEG
jgi:hypothetical protein